MTHTKTRARLTAEIEELTRLTAGAPETHPARIALRKLAEFLPVANEDWYDVHSGMDARTLCNEIAKGTASGICVHRATWTWRY